MSDYCEQDVVVTIRLFEKCEAKKPSPEAVEIETGVETIIHRQVANGIQFNKEKAEELYLELLNERERLREELTSLFPPFYKKGKLFTPKLFTILPVRLAQRLS
jgi:DNA polymerase I-like protein with 3'-5' exonuclease and polymerase domains